MGSLETDLEQVNCLAAVNCIRRCALLTSLALGYYEEMVCTSTSREGSSSTGQTLC